MPNKKSASSDLQGIIKLLTDATISTIDIAEALHKQVVTPRFLPSTKVQKLVSKVAGVAFKNTKWSTKLVGKSIEKLLGQLGSLLGEFEVTDEREAVRSILNGVIGDYLEANNNPLQITMQFRNEGKTLELNKSRINEAYSKLTGKLLVMVHGSCMNDLQWTQNEHNHGNALANNLNMTPVYLFYNSGRHISTNGKNLSELLEDLTSNWPVPVEELNIIGHSMGGLVIRSAVYYGHQNKTLWTKLVHKTFYLGSPHHGSTLEQAGNYLDVILEKIPFASPFAKLGKIRSAGVTDLRYGSIVDEDWEDADRFKLQGDMRKSIPLPLSIKHYAIAGSIGKTARSVKAKLLGDNMVGINSALGKHADSDKNLNFKKKNTWIAYENTHMDLLSSPDVYNKLLGWLD